MDTLWIVFAVMCAWVVYGVVIFVIAQLVGTNAKDDQ